MQANSSSVSGGFYTDITRALSFDAPAQAVVISPHLDDAIWSIGPVLKMLAEHGHQLRLANLFSLSVLAQKAMSPADGTAIRKAEDRRASQDVGFQEVIYLDFPDGILRDRDVERIFDPKYETPAWLFERLCAAMQQHIPADALVLAPSGFGWHIDHQLAARLAVQLPNRVIFYEDMPYAARTVRVQEAREFLQKQGAQEIRLPADAATIQEHLRLYRLYGSQRAQHHEDQITSYLSAHGYGLWRPAAVSV